MDELIGQLAAKVGIDEAVAEKTIGIILGFLRNEGPSDKVQALIDQIPGAEAAIAASSSPAVVRMPSDLSFEAAKAGRPSISEMGYVMILDIGRCFKRTD